MFRDIGLNDCHFEATPVLRAAVINRLFLDGSSLPGLLADRLEARGGVYLRGAQVEGAVSIAESRLGGNLECDGATIRTLGGYALIAPGMEVRNVLARGAVIRGGINISGAQLAADLDCAGADFTGTEGIAIHAGESQIRGTALLRSTRVEGEVRLTASEIAGDLDCSGAALDNSGRHGPRHEPRDREGRVLPAQGSPGDGDARDDRRRDRHHPRRGFVLAQGGRSPAQSVPLRGIHRRSRRCREPARLARAADAGAMGRGFLAPALRAAGDRVQADGPRRGCAQGLDRQGTAAAAGPALARIKSCSSASSSL